MTPSRSAFGACLARCIDRERSLLRQAPTVHWAPGVRSRAPGARGPRAGSAGADAAARPWRSRWPAVLLWFAMAVPGMAGLAATAAAAPAVRSGDVLTAEDWARLRGEGLTSAGAQGSEIFRKLAPSIVFIYGKLKPRGGKPAGTSSGTGSLVSADGLILTNQHVVADADTLYVALYPPGGRRELTPEDLRLARVVRVDARRDLALVRLVEAPPGLQPVPFADLARLQVGDEVHAIGHPLGNTWTYTKGIVSQIRDDFHWQDNTGLKRQASVIQTQTPISPGNSGGPLLDGNGRLVGVNSFVTSGQSAQGLNFAVAVSEVERFLLARGEAAAPAAVPAPAQAENCKDGEARIIRRYRNSTNDHDFADVDFDCDGGADLTLRVPDNPRLAIRYTVERQGRTVTVFVDLKRADRIDYSLHDTDGDGVPDRIGVHPDGKFAPASFRPFRGEASVREVLQGR
jgi:S1-C subfamily serine protease